MKAIKKQTIILGLDDSKTMRTVLNDLLADRYSLTLTGTVTEFTHALKERVPHIFILDVNLPDGNGIEICRKLKNNALYHESIVILITSSSSATVIEEGYEAGANDFIRKPVIPLEVKTKIELYAKLLNDRETLNNAYKRQVRQNRRMQNLAKIVRDHIKKRGLDESFHIMEGIGEVTSCGYMEIIQKRDNLFNSVLSRHIDKEGVFRPFHELSEKIDLPAQEEEYREFKLHIDATPLYCLAAPLKIESTILGYLILESRHPFHAEDIEMIHLFTSFFAIIHSRFTVERAIERMNREYKNEISKVRKIQVSNLPDFHAIKEYSISSAFLPAADISGDFFDAYFISENIFQVIICDVSGHGIASSYIGNQLRTLFKINSSPRTSPAELAKRVNDVLAQDLKGLYYFATACIVQIEMGEGHIRYVNAGHPPLLYYNSDSDDHALLKNSGPLIGLFEDNEYREKKLTMKKGDCLLLYTDGVTEATAFTDNKAEMYGEQRLLKTFLSLQENTCRDIIHSIIGSLYEFMEYADQEDDITIICIKKEDRPEES